MKNQNICTDTIPPEYATKFSSYRILTGLMIIAIFFVLVGLFWGFERLNERAEAPIHKAKKERVVDALMVRYDLTREKAEAEYTIRTEIGR